jgi:pimeloyl-ACP methyl ester carboxylesterase
MLETIHFTGAGGIRLVGDVGGDVGAPLVLLLHGGGQTRHSWRGAMHALIANGYRAISLDARGHGDSEWAADGDYRFATLASDLECVLASLPSAPALVGASMGGGTALTLVGKHTAQVARALVLVDIVPRMDPLGIAKIQDFMSANSNGFASLEEAADAVSTYNPHRPRPNDLSGLMKNLRHRPDGRLYWHWDPRVIADPDGSIQRRDLDQLAAAAANVRIPTLLLRGMHSDVVTDAGVADARRSITDLEVINVAEAGHMIAGDKNDAFNEGLMAFLRRHLKP